MAKKECTHPTWREEHDGHHNQGWTCTECGHWQWIAPWVLNAKNDWPDVS